MVLMFLNGEGMRGGRLHHQLSGAPLLRTARSAPKYRYYSVADRFPAMIATDTDGRSVTGEVYDVPMEVLRDNLVPAEPEELELDLIELDDGTACLATVLRKNLLGSPDLIDISDIGDWRAYRSTATAG
ncbi:gamma-glutamylcyclotransferase [Nocardia transvalensis]|uniref:allophanate hydrolase-related protein n=1 Tax=Nocardia transvalensis TaxID=37333 RepID=UPI00189557DC|nr:gamma-glutamylcyclotransferase [Nocardia transvalensis]MBF6333074.1 gamma-glutamylcyclotransferase [Nocardia transvalensis]